MDQTIQRISSCISPPRFIIINKSPTDILTTMKHKLKVKSDGWTEDVFITACYFIQSRPDDQYRLFNVSECWHHKQNHLKTNLSEINDSTII